jgi:hypothetical protein
VAIRPVTRIHHPYATGWPGSRTMTRWDDQGDASGGMSVGWPSLRR